jgi:hypothetical protein
MTSSATIKLDMTVHRASRLQAKGGINHTVARSIAKSTSIHETRAKLPHTL